MPKKVASIFFSVIFLLFIAAPTAITLLDSSIDVSVFYTASEEEEKGSEKDKDIEVLFFEFQNNELDFVSSKRVPNSKHCFKNYSKPHLNLISPPPEYL